MRRLRKIVCTLVLIASIGLSLSLLDIRLLRASGTIYIHADGTIEPADANITRDGNSYIFTADIEDSIVVEKDGILIDGANYTLRGTGTDTGIYLNERDDITITNLRISKFQYGLRVSSSLNINISDNIITDNDIGIYFATCSSSTVSGNVLSNMTYMPIKFEGSSSNEIIGNHFKNSTYGIILQSSSNLNAIVGNNTIENVHGLYTLPSYPYYAGILIQSSSNNNVSGNSIKSCFQDGIFLLGSSNDTIQRNNITQVRDAIEVDYSSNINITQNKIEDSETGITIGEGSGNTVLSNDLVRNRHGLSLVFTTDNFVSENTVVNSTEGIEIYSSGSNVLRNNTIVGCESSFDVSGSEHSDFINDVDTSNMIDGKCIEYLIGKQNLIIEPPSHNVAYLVIVDSSNVIIRNFESGDNLEGVTIAFSENSLVQNIAVQRIKLSSSSHSIVYGNTVANGGIGLVRSSDNDVIRNDVVNCSILLFNSQANFLSRNNVSGKGITIESVSYNNILCENHLANNINGITLHASGNEIYLNNFTDNLLHVYIDPEEDYANIWHNGTHGNYWSNYTGIDVDPPYGIGDTPHIINENNTDDHPLMDPWVPTLPIVAVLLDPVQPRSHEATKVSVLCDLPAEKILFSYKDENGQRWNTSMFHNSTIGLWTVVVPLLNNSVFEFDINVFDGLGHKSTYSYERDVKFIWAEDVVRDGKIDIKDLATVAKLYGAIYDP